jgi:hypothetical protein
VTHSRRAGGVSLIGSVDPQPIQSAAFNLSLDKYPQMRYSLVKVLLTVSPFRPSFPPPLNVFSQPCNSRRQSRRIGAEILPTTHRSLSTFCQLTPLSTAFTPDRSLTPLSTAFTQTDGGVEYFWGGSAASRLVTSHRPAPTRSGSQIPSHVFSYYCALFVALAALFATAVLYFQQLTRSLVKTPGVGGTSATAQRSAPAPSRSGRLGVIICRRFLVPLFSYRYKSLFS